jgi:shikimate 5-dehydrogenase
MDFIKNTKPTHYFIGVTTGISAIMKIFPEWAKYFQLGDCQIKGMNFPLNTERGAYREAVNFIKNDPYAVGALVTTHKINLLKACRDLFDSLDPYAALLGEVSCISKNGDQLVGHAKDAITAELALKAIIGEGYWQRTHAELLCLGAGGANVALTTCLMQRTNGDKPSKIIVTDKSEDRLLEMEAVHQKIKLNTEIQYKLVKNVSDTEGVVEGLKQGSVIANGTGMGKDTPGSPLSDTTIFPKNGVVWEYNYRGDLQFLAQAKRQQTTQNLTIADGWVYFIHGWTRVLAETFHVDIPTTGGMFEELSRIAAQYR